MPEENLLEELTEATIEGKYKLIGKIVRKARRKGLEVQEIINALSTGIVDVSDKYKTQGMYLDDIVKSAAAFEVGVQSLGIPEEEKDPEDKVVIGVMGGPWTIGNSIVAANLKAHGFQVIDAGSDIPPEKFIDVIKDSKAKIIASAIYLTHSKAEVEKLEELLWKSGLRHKIRTILSGPAGSKAMAQTLNVDSYVKDVKELIIQVKKYSEELKSEMTSFDRVMTTLKHKEPDRVPFIPFAQTFSAKFAGIPFSAYVSKAEKMAEGQLKTYRALGWDALCFSSDVGMYAGALGAKIDFPEDDVPRIVEPVLSHGKLYEDFQKLNMVDPRKAGRLTESIKAIEIAKKELGDEVPLIGWLEAPFQGTALLGGGDPFLLFYVLDHPDEFREMLDWYADWAIEIAKAMHEAGADIIGCGETAGYFMSPQFFKDFVLEPEKKLCSGIRKIGMTPLIHCCGYVPQCVPFVKETNLGGAIQFDYQVDLKWAKELLKNEVTIMGNLNYNKLVDATPQQVYEDCADHIRIAAKGGGYWLAFGCEIPRDLPQENIRAILRAARTLKYPVE